MHSCRCKPDSVGRTHLPRYARAHNGSRLEGAAPTKFGLLPAALLVSRWLRSCPKASAFKGPTEVVSLTSSQVRVERLSGSPDFPLRGNHPQRVRVETRSRSLEAVEPAERHGASLVVAVVVAGLPVLGRQHVQHVDQEPVE